VGSVPSVAKATSPPPSVVKPFSAISFMKREIGKMGRRENVEKDRRISARVNKGRQQREKKSSKRSLSFTKV